jgi:hypothetical protein
LILDFRFSTRLRFPAMICHVIILALLTALVATDQENAE